MSLPGKITLPIDQVDFTPRVVRLGLIIFIVGLALAMPLGRAASAQAAFISLSLFLAVLAIAKVSDGNYAKVKIFLFFLLLLAAAFVRAAFVKDTAWPAQFEAEVFSDTIATSYGSLTVIKNPETGQRLKILARRYPEFQTGDRVEVKIKSEDQKYTGFAKGDLNLIKKAQGPSLLMALATVKRQFLSGLAAVLPEPHASFAAGTVVGGSAGLPKDLKDVFTASGVSHVLAASGYNFTLLLFFLGLLLQTLPVRWQSLVFLLFIPCFALIAGASAAVMRAAVMGGLVVLALMLGRLSSAKSALLWAGALLLLWQPDSLKLDIGFQLSFLATFGLVYLTPIFTKLFRLKERRSGFWPKFRFKALEIFSATLAAQILTWPLIAYTFGTTSLAAVLVNLLVLPLIPAVMILSMAASALGLLWPILGRILALAVWFVSEFIFKVVQFFANFTWSQAHIQISMFALFSLYALMFAAIFYYHFKFLRHRFRES